MTYAYDADAFGNRIQRDAWDGSTATTQRFALDGWDTAKPRALGREGFEAWADLDGSNALATRSISGPQFGAPIARQTAGGVVSWHSTDLQGSVRLVLDNSGSITNAIGYDAFGAVISGSPPDRFGFAMMQRDSITLLSSAGNGTRDYNADTGTWQQEDPLGLRPDVNPRRYVGNSPTNAVDPNGMASQPVNGRGGRKPVPPENLPIVNVTDDPAKVNIGKDPNWKPVPGGGWIYFNNNKMEQDAYQREDGLWVITDYRRPFVLEAEPMTDSELLALGHTPRPAMQFLPVRPDPFREFVQTPAGQFVSGFSHGVFQALAAPLFLPDTAFMFIGDILGEPYYRDQMQQAMTAHAELNRSFWAGDPRAIGFVFGTFTPDAVLTFATFGGGTAFRATNHVDDTWQFLSREGSHQPHVAVHSHDFIGPLNRFDVRLTPPEVFAPSAGSSAASNSRPMFSADWQQLFANRYGAENVEWMTSPTNQLWRQTWRESVRLQGSGGLPNATSVVEGAVHVETGTVVVRPSGGPGSLTGLRRLDILDLPNPQREFYPPGVCGMPQAVRGLAESFGGHLPEGTILVTRGGFQYSQTEAAWYFMTPCRNCVGIMELNPFLRASPLPRGVQFPPGVGEGNLPTPRAFPFNPAEGP